MKKMLQVVALLVVATSAICSGKKSHAVDTDQADLGSDQIDQSPLQISPLDAPLFKKSSGSSFFQRPIDEIGSAFLKRSLDYSDIDDPPDMTDDPDLLLTDDPDLQFSEDSSPSDSEDRPNDSAISSFVPGESSNDGLMKKSEDSLRRYFFQKPIDQIGSSFIKRDRSRFQNRPIDQIGSSFIKRDRSRFQNRPIDQIGSSFIKRGTNSRFQNRPIDQIGSSFIKRDIKSRFQNRPIDQIGSSFIKRDSRSRFQNRPIDQIGSSFIKRDSRSRFQNRPIDQIGSSFIKRGPYSFDDSFFKRPIEQIGNSFIKKNVPSFDKSSFKRPIESIGNSFIKRNQSPTRKSFFQRPIDTIGSSFIKKNMAPTFGPNVDSSMTTGPDSIGCLSTAQPMESTKDAPSKRNADSIGGSFWKGPIEYHQTNSFNNNNDKLLWETNGREFRKRPSGNLWRGHIKRPIDSIGSSFIKRQAETVGEGEGFGGTENGLSQSEDDNNESSDDFVYMPDSSAGRKDE